MDNKQNNNSACNMQNYLSIPDEMKAYPNFVLSRLEDRGGAKPAKVPYSVHGGMAKVNDPSTWGTFDEAQQAYQRGGFDGIGFVFTNTPFVGIDIDGCYDEHGNLSENADQAWRIASSYTELSQSGQGLHIILRGTLPPGDRRNTQTGFEMYGHGSPRYFVMTGNTGGQQFPIREDQAAIDEIHARYIEKPLSASAVLAVPEGTAGDEDEGSAVPIDSASDEDYLAVGLAQDATLISLWNGERPHQNESADDMALLNKLRYWCNGNAAIMKQAFLASPHYQLKDDEHKKKCQRKDYLPNTIKKALTGPYMTARMKNAMWQKEHGSSVCVDGIVVEDALETMFLSLIPFERPDDSSNPDFPVEMLPDLLRRYAVAVSSFLQVSVDMIAVSLLQILSLLAQKRFEVQPRLGWVEAVNLFSLIIARASDRKTPSLNQPMKPIYECVTRENERRQPLVDEYLMKCNLLKRKIESLAKAIANGKPPKNLLVPPEIELKRLTNELTTLQSNPVDYLTLISDDITSESLGITLASNSEKLGLISGEGAGIFQILSGLYSGGASNIDIVLKSYSGNEPVHINRVGRKAVQMASPTLTILLMIQPSVLEEIMGNKAFNGRGLLARFLYSKPTSTVGNRAYNTQPIDLALESEYKELIYRLFELATSDDISTITFSPEAEAEAELLHDYIEAKLRDDSYEMLEEWLGKQHGRTMRIAALLHIAEHVEQAADIPVSGETVANARIIGDYFIAQAKNAFQYMGAADDEATADAKYILKRLMESGEDEISKRDLYQLCSRSRFPKTVDMQPGLDVLVDRGYIAIRKEVPANNHQNHQKVGGRPTEIIYINPLLTVGEDSDPSSQHSLRESHCEGGNMQNSVG